MRPPTLSSRGFTIIELLVVLTIGAILAAVAVPSMRDMLNTNRLNAAVALIVNDLNQARGEAIKRNTRVLVCRRNAAGTDCVPGTGAPEDWRAGWVVCIEGLVVGECAAGTAANPNPLIVRPPLDDTLTFTSPLAVVRFNPNSSATAATTLNLGGTWSGAPARTVSVAIAGGITKQ